MTSVFADDTLGKKASYSLDADATSTKDNVALVRQLTEPPVKQLNYNQFDTAIREPKPKMTETAGAKVGQKAAPSPIIYPDEDACCCGSQALCVRLGLACPCCARVCHRKKTKIVVAAFALAMILLLIIILPLVLTIGTEDDESQRRLNDQAAISKTTTLLPLPDFMLNITKIDDDNSTLLWSNSTAEPEPEPEETTFFEPETTAEVTEASSTPEPTELTTKSSSTDSTSSSRGTTPSTAPTTRRPVTQPPTAPTTNRPVTPPPTAPTTKRPVTPPPTAPTTKRPVTPPPTAPTTNRPTPVPTTQNVPSQRPVPTQFSSGTHSSKAMIPITGPPPMKISLPTGTKAEPTEPTSVAAVTEVHSDCDSEVEVDKVECADGLKYPRRVACSGEISACMQSCTECDEELAFDCSPGCIPIRQTCDGIAHCSDGSDEFIDVCACDDQKYHCPTTSNDSQQQFRKCIPQEFVCDGYPDCPGGFEEKNCTKCTKKQQVDKEPVHCSLDQTCFSSNKRCDGEPDCSDYSDEENCSCLDCKSHNYPTYRCDRDHRCLKMEYACDANMDFNCLNSTDKDTQFCTTFSPAPKEP